MPARKTKPQQQAPRPAPSGRDFTITAGTIKWVVGVILGFGALVTLYWQGSDRVTSALDARWRLEQVQASKDKEFAAEMKRVDSDIKSAREKEEQDIKALAKKAEVGRAWVLWRVIDGNANTAASFARICRALKLPADECARQDSDALMVRQEAAEAKRAATDAGKDK